MKNKKKILKTKKKTNKKLEPFFANLHKSHYGQIKIFNFTLTVTKKTSLY